MKKETQVTIQNNFIWALAVIGWVFMIAEFHNSYYELVNLPVGVAPPIQVIGLLVFQTAFYGLFVVTFPIIFIVQSIDFLKACKKDLHRAPKEGEIQMSGFEQYRRKELAELRPYVEGEVLDSRISISQADLDNDSPKAGDMIARNPKNHKDQWLVAQDYFKDNFEPIDS